MRERSERYVPPGKWHWLSDRAANTALIIFLFVIFVTPFIGLITGVVVSAPIGVTTAYVFAGGGVVIGLYLLALSIIFAVFQTNGVPIIE